MAYHSKWGEKTGQPTKANIVLASAALDQETKRMDVCPMKKISRIRLLFPVFVFLLWAPRPSYCAISHDGTSTTTCAKAFGTAAGETHSVSTSSTTDGDCWFRKKLRPGALAQTLVWQSAFHAALSATPTSPRPDSVSSGIAFEATTATVFSDFN